MENLLKYVELFQILSENFTGGELGKKVTQKMIKYPIFLFIFTNEKELNLI